MKGNEWFARLTDAVKKSAQQYRAVWLVILLGLVFLLLPDSGREKAEPEGRPVSAESQFDLMATEERLAEALSRIDGAGEVTVMLTLQNGPKQVLAQNVDRDTDSGERRETVVLSRGTGNQETVTVQELYPGYQGALLICPGGDDPDVRLKLTEATSALTGLGADKISISKGK